MLGAFVSISANVAHSYIPPTGAPAEWSPKAGAVLFSIFWPAALAVVIEIAARVAWPRGWRYVAVRLLGLLPVAGVAAVVSYRHLSGLLAYYGEDVVTIAAGPIAVDGLMLIATTAVIITGRRVEPAPALTPVAVLHPRPRPAVVPAGARLLPLINSLSAPQGDGIPTPTPDDAEAGQSPSAGELGILPPPPGGRPATETRKLFDALKAENPKITQQEAAVKLGIARWTLRSALAATEPAA